MDDQLDPFVVVWGDDHRGDDRGVGCAGRTVTWHEHGRAREATLRGLTPGHWLERQRRRHPSRSGDRGWHHRVVRRIRRQTVPVGVREQPEGDTTAVALKSVRQARERVTRQEAPQRLDIARCHALGHVEPQQPLRLQAGGRVEQTVDRRRTRPRPARLGVQ